MYGRRADIWIDAEGEVGAGRVEQAENSTIGKPENQGRAICSELPCPDLLDLYADLFM
jgi:hypothetical protein